MAGRGDPRKASDRRSASPPSAWGGGERRVVSLKPMGPSNFGFPEVTVTPSAGEQANPRHGFVSRPGGAFKFQAVRQMPTQAPKNPYQVPGSRVCLHARSAVRGLSAVASHDCSLAQELRTLTHSSSGSTRHTSSSQAVTHSLSVSGARGDRSRAGTSHDVASPPRAGSSDVEVRLDDTLVLVERSESPGCGKPVLKIWGVYSLSHIPRPVFCRRKSQRSKTCTSHWPRRKNPSVTYKMSPQTTCKVRRTYVYWTPPTPRYTMRCSGIGRAGGKTTDRGNTNQ